MLERSSSITKSSPNDGRGVAATGGGIFWPLRKRQHPRFDIPLEGILHKGDKSVPCRLRNISAGGALIELDPSALSEINTSLRVAQPAKVEIPEIGMFKAHPTRVHWKFAGMSFEEGAEEVGAFIKHWLDGPGQADRPH